MGAKDKAKGVVGGVAIDRIMGERPGFFRAAAGAAVAGGFTSIIVFRLLRHGEDED